MKKTSYRDLTGVEDRCILGTHNTLAIGVKYTTMEREKVCTGLDGLENFDVSIPRVAYS